MWYFIVYKIIYRIFYSAKKHAVIFVSYIIIYFFKSYSNIHSVIKITKTVYLIVPCPAPVLYIVIILAFSAKCVTSSNFQMLCIYIFP